MTDKDAENRIRSRNHSDCRAAQGAGQQPFASRSRLDVSSGRQHRKKHHDQPGQMRLGLMGAVDDDWHAREGQPCGGGNEPSPGNSTHDRKDRNNAQNSPTGRIEPGNDVHPSETFGMIQIPAHARTKGDITRPGSGIEQRSNRVDPQSAVLIHPGIESKFRWPHPGQGPKRDHFVGLIAEQPIPTDNRRAIGVGGVQRQQWSRPVRGEWATSAPRSGLSSQSPANSTIRAPVHGMRSPKR